jgi:hypothetical protein
MGRFERVQIGPWLRILFWTISLDARDNERTVVRDAGRTGFDCVGQQGAYPQDLSEEAVMVMDLSEPSPRRRKVSEASVRVKAPMHLTVENAPIETIEKMAAIGLGVSFVPLLSVEERRRFVSGLDGAAPEHRMTVRVERLRRCPALDCKFVVHGNNGILGAATTSVLNAELMVARALCAPPLAKS